MQNVKEVNVFRVLTIFLLGLVCGVQTALYLFDLYDDGIADIKSALIAGVMVALSVGYIFFTFRTKKSAGRES